MIDWSRTVAFAATPTSNGIHIVKKRDGEPCGVAAEDYAALRRQLIDELLAVKDPESGEPVVERVSTREEVYPGPHEQFGPDLTLTLRDGGLVSILPSREFLRKRSEVAGAHRPAGIFAARGPAIRKGIRSSALSILDVAPMVTYLSGLPLHESFQGRLPVELIRRQWLENAPPQRSGYEEARVHAAGAAGGDKAAGDAAGESDDQAILDGMRELGYIE
jgi:predicted AlkP superfamily phosphohydrolase/phosphomutase